MRNSAIDPNGVDEGPFAATVDACRDRELVLAIQDTTTLNPMLAASCELAEHGAPSPGLVVTLMSTMRREAISITTKTQATVKRAVGT